MDGLRAGADDYLTKPFSFEELLARNEALLRRGELRRSDPTLRVGDLTLDPATRSVRRGGREIALTPQEFALLRCLMEHAGAPLSRSSILSQVWGYSFDPGAKVVDVYVFCLRRKIDRDREKPLIQTVRGVGYRISEWSGPVAPRAARSAATFGWSLVRPDPIPGSLVRESFRLS